jgi:tetratricopeptide (TPR) repeat protein
VASRTRRGPGSATGAAPRSRRLHARRARSAALPLAEEAAAIAQQLGHLVLEATALNALGVALAEAGRFEEGLVATDRSLALALETGSLDTPRSYVNVSSLEFGLGRVVSAAARHHEALALAHRTEQIAFVDWISRELVICAYVLGDWDDALIRARECLGVSRERGEPHYMDIPVQLVEAAIVLGREGTLLEDRVDNSLERARAIGDPQILKPTLADAALLLADQGRVDESRALLDEYTADSRYPDSSIVAAALAWARVSVGGFPMDRYPQPTTWMEAARLIGQGELAAAATVLGEMGARTIEARVRLHAASVLATQDADAARRQLELAHSFWRSVGAAALLVRANEVDAALRAAAS